MRNIYELFMRELFCQLSNIRSTKKTLFYLLVPQIKESFLF